MYLTCFAFAWSGRKQLRRRAPLLPPRSNFSLLIGSCQQQASWHRLHPETNTWRMSVDRLIRTRVKVTSNNILLMIYSIRLLCYTALIHIQNQKQVRTIINQSNDGVTSMSSSQLVSCALGLVFLSLKQIKSLWNICVWLVFCDITMCVEIHVCGNTCYLVTAPTVITVRSTATVSKIMSTALLNNARPSV